MCFLVPRGFVLLVSFVSVLLAMDNKNLFASSNKYMAFKWLCSDPKLAKAVKARVGVMMAESHSYHKTAVQWHDVQFVKTGVVIPFKHASLYRVSYAWLYRSLMPFITKAPGSHDGWVWEPVESELVIQEPGLVKREPGLVKQEPGLVEQEPEPSDEASSSGSLRLGAGAAAARRGLELFPPSVALKVARGTPWLGIYGRWLGLGMLFSGARRGLGV